MADLDLSSPVLCEPKMLQNLLALAGTTQPGGRFTAGGATQTLSTASEGKVTRLDTAAGTVITLPAATGSGATYRFVVSTLATSNSHIIKVANANDTMVGTIISVEDTAGTMAGYATAATSDTITLNRTTTGSVTLGEWIECTDIAVNKWAVRGQTTHNAAPATPFSATVP